jgi:DNA polymerase III epsilon subunit-like protein
MEKTRPPIRKSLLVVDTETTGLHPDINYPISLGVVVVSPMLTKDYQRRWDIRLPLSEWSQVLTAEFWRAKRVHRHSLSRILFQGDSPDDVLDDLDTLAEEYPGTQIAGQNALFDLYFIRRLYESRGRKMPFDFHAIDLSTLGSIHLGVRSLGNIARALGIDPIHYDQHDALEDARLTADCFIELFTRISMTI